VKGLSIVSPVVNPSLQPVKNKTIDFDTDLSIHFFSVLFHILIMMRQGRAFYTAWFESAKDTSTPQERCCVQTSRSKEWRHRRLLSKRPVPYMQSMFGIYHRTRRKPSAIVMMIPVHIISLGESSNSRSFCVRTLVFWSSTRGSVGLDERTKWKLPCSMSK